MLILLSLSYLILWKLYQNCKQDVMNYRQTIQVNINIHIRLFQSQQMQVHQLLDLDYTNIEDTAQLKSIIQVYNMHLDIKVKEMQELSHICEMNKAQAKSIIKKMEETYQQSTQRTLFYEKQIEKQIKKQDIKMAEISEDHDKTIKAYDQKYQQNVSSLNQRIAGLKQQQERLSDLQKQQHGFLTEIKQKSSSLNSQQYDHHDNMNKLEDKLEQENKALFIKNRDLIKALKKDVKMEAGRIVYQQKYENEDKNYELKVKLLQLQDQVNKLRKRRNQIVKSRNEQKINVSLNEEEIQQYKAVGSIQKSKIKAYSDKFEALKKSIAGEIAKLETKIKEKKSKWQNELKGSKMRLSNLQNEKQELKINLERYKLLGQTILMQRQEVEQFFLMAIESCRKQMSETGGLSENTDKQYGQKVDIDELLPKDRHRIITNLYTKLALAPSK